MSEPFLSKIQRILRIDSPSISARLTTDKTEKISLTFFNCLPQKLFSIHPHTKTILFPFILYLIILTFGVGVKETKIFLF